jgi:Protein of unknown function (DUF3293)
MFTATSSSKTGGMSGDPVRSRLLRPYLETDYEAARAIARVGQRSAEIDRLLLAMGVREGAFVTAWNPLSKRRPIGWNERMQARLLEHIRRLPSSAGRGTGRGWSEQHLLVGGDIRRIVVLAGFFRQSAIVVVRRLQPARLFMLGPRHANSATVRLGACVQHGGCRSGLLSRNTKGWPLDDSEA